VGAAGLQAWGLAPPRRHRPHGYLLARGLGMNGITACAIGRLGQDAELRYTQTGTALLSCSIAVQDDRAAEGTPPQWLKIAVFGERAEALDAAGALVKGSEVYTEGRLKLNRWTTPEGEARSGLELQAWRLDVLGAIGKRRPARPQQAQLVGER
jgi:single-strand DNA-binding protein